VPDAKGGFDCLYEVLAGHEKLALAVSGGSDSTALMFLTAQWARQNERLDDFCVLTVDHALRENSDREAGEVCSWARALGFECHVLVWQHDGHSSRVQEKARAGRYELMGRWCADHNVAGIITAHNRDDQAETLLMRLARGSGVDGLAAMRAGAQLFGVEVFRPLLGVSREDLQAVLQQAGHGWIDDPSNDDSRFERVRVRGIMSVLEAAGIDADSINLSASRLQRASVALEDVTDQFMASSVTVFDSGHCEVDRPAFEELADDIAIRVLTRLLEWAGGGSEPLRMAKVERLYETLAESEQHTLAGARIAMRKGCFLIGREFGRIEAGPATGVKVWDNRFVFSHHQDVQPYGVFIENDDRQRPAHLPFFVACSLPVFVEKNKKTKASVVPHLDFIEADGVKLRSLPKGVGKANAFRR